MDRTMTDSQLCWTVFRLKARVQEPHRHEPALSS
jgi:hypothetical protein